MMNKIEKHKIENILNNLDENEGIEELWEKLENKKKQIENKMNNQNPKTTTPNLSMNDSGIYSNYSQDLNSTLSQSDLFNESIISQVDIENVLNSTFCQEENLRPDQENSFLENSEAPENQKTDDSNPTTSQESLTEPQNIDKNVFDSLINSEVIKSQEAVSLDNSENPRVGENPIEETQEKVLDQNPIVENAGETLTMDDSFDVFDDLVSDISNFDEDFDKAKIDALKEVRVRLKRLTEDELFEKSEAYRKKVKKINEEEITACLNCTGCTALKHICSLDNVKSEAKKKEEVMKVEKRSLRKRGIEPDQNQLSKKRIRLSKNRITAQKKDFDSFYDECYKNLKWIDDKLTVDNKILSKISKKQTKKDQKSDINSNDIYEEEEDHTEEKTTEIDTNENEDFTNDMDYGDDETSEMDPELNTESDKNNELIDKSDKNDEDNIIKSAEQDLETSKVCHEVLSSLIDEVSNLDKTSEGINIRFSQESGFSEDFFTENDFDSLNQTQFEKELDNLSHQNKDILGLEKSNPMLTNLNDTCWSPCHFPHTPAHSEDSGRFSSAACHSDIEGTDLNRSIHHDSGVEMSHQSEDEDDNNSDIMPFKNLDPKSLTFYKRKCESLLEQRERDQKVREWQKFLKEKEETKIKLPEFHIDEYETKILNALPDESTKLITFNSVVENKSAEEVARFFAATLQLANMNNVKISENHLKADGTNDSFKLSLISREKYYENIELSDSFMENLSKKPFLTSTPFKAPKPKFKKSNKF